jgi:hypothetical protein
MPLVDTIATIAKIPKRCGCQFAMKNGFHSCERVNETNHRKKEAADRKIRKKAATEKRRQIKKNMTANIRKAKKDVAAQIKKKKICFSTSRDKVWIEGISE